ncbi:hypothetical protein [Isoptericola sp. AK164]|uniref:hypothetical protein n=1 Tax=Isoptericola sp. AK164 TaxID=3024246 RepID=UPI0024181B35|nr:hypothetical protein [Isoptericola sp. AK164]
MRRHTSRATALLLGALLVAGCTAPVDDDGASPTPSDTAVDGGTSAPLDPDVAGEPPLEGGEEPPLPPDDAGPTLTIVGLPAGGGAAGLVDDAWCGAIAVGQAPPDGVELEVTGLRTDPGGLETPALACQDVPACLGSTLSQEQHLCAVAVVPPPGADQVRVAVDVRLECAEVTACEEYRASVTPGFWWVLDRPLEAGPATAPSDPEVPDEPEGADEPEGPDEPEGEGSP